MKDCKHCPFDRADAVTHSAIMFSHPSVLWRGRVR